jgi:methylthioribose-1-phosphate isomerase
LDNSSSHQQAEQMRTFWFDERVGEIRFIDQTRLPHELKILTLASVEQACQAIEGMQVRGAPLIGITAAFGVWLAMQRDPESLQAVCQRLLATRPTAVNLQWALSRVERELSVTTPRLREERALMLARTLLDEDIAACAAIGDHGLEVLRRLLHNKQQFEDAAVLNILTHCNAGWLATGAWGTALAPVYKAHLAGLPVHVWVDETRPRNQGASLTSWELGRSGVPHTLIVDNAGGHLMQHGMVDVCLVGSDRTTAQGDVCNKIGTYLKALAAFDNRVPFFAALPVSTIDFNCFDGIKEIPIEQRDGDEVRVMSGLDRASGQIQQLMIAPPSTAVSNFGFDVTPARLISGLITELGVVPASMEGLAALRAAIA